MATIALAGNPNSGKTSLFNRLTGLSQKVGNYPGVTVERRSGSTRLTLPSAEGGHEATVEVVDLPGAYSLVARGRDEAVAFEALVGLTGAPPPDLVVVVVDATNLVRNLYFALSVLELGRPTVVALNMMDEARASGLEVDATKLEQRLGAPVVPMAARTGEGVELLREVVEEQLATPLGASPRLWELDADGEAFITDVQSSLQDRPGREALAVWALSTAATATSEGLSPHELAASPLASALERATRLVADTDEDLAAAVIEARYAVVRDIVGEVERRPAPAQSRTDRLDSVLLHPVWGLLIFAATMAVLFQSIFAWADPLMTLIENGVGLLQSGLRSLLPSGAVVDLLADGVVGGVGNVLVFVPQIAFLFGFLAVLEDSGYLARAAFISDRWMARIGLHGRAFVPLLSGFACAVPAIMATRSIESRKDRLTTILVIPLVSCSARLPIYTLLIATLFSANERVLGVLSLGGLMMFGLYGLSILFTVGVGYVLKRTVLTSPTPPLVLELPPYRAPELRSVLTRVVDRCWVFIKDAGTVILACSMILWALLYFPSQVPADFELERKQASVAQIASPEARGEAEVQLLDEAEAARVANSIAGQLGHALEPAFAPLGYDWKMVVGILASFAAREVFVSTLGLVYGMGDAADEESLSLRERLRDEVHPDTGKPVYTPLVGLSLMVFFLLALQCMSTLAAVRRETRSWSWTVFAFGYTGALAWIMAFLVYQSGRLWGFA